MLSETGVTDATGETGERRCISRVSLVTPVTLVSLEKNMHDLHVADKIHKLVLAQAQQNNLSVVKNITIDLGSVVEHGANIAKENLEFNLKMLNKGTVADSAEIIINEVDGNDWNLVSISGD